MGQTGNQVAIDATGKHFQAVNQQIREAESPGIRLDNVLGHRYIGAGSDGRDIEIHGTPGNALGAYLNGGSIHVLGNAQDATGDTMNAGSIVIHGSSGDTTGYAMRGGAIYVRDRAGYRVGIHMKEYGGQKPVIVVGGSAGAFLGEYQAGGVIVVLGLGCECIPVGSYCGTGMHGGAMYIRSPRPLAGLPPQVSVSQVEDLSPIQPYLDNYCRLFGADPAQLRGDYYQLTPNSNNPYQQMYTHI